METKANYLLIGVFTLVGLVGSMLFLLWLAKVEVDRQYSYYDVLFDNVTGLGDAGDVRFNGLPVGQVIGLSLDDDDPSKVRVRIEVVAETPVKSDTVAVLQGQGVTGVSFVALTGASADASPLAEGATIPSETSPIQSVLEGAPVLLNRAVDLLEDVNKVVSTENREAVTLILNNLASASGRLDRSLAEIEQLSANLSTAALEVTAFTGRLDALADTADTTLTTATATLETAQSAIGRGETVLAMADTTLKTINESFATASDLIDGDIRVLVQEGTRTLTSASDTLASTRTFIEGDVSEFVRQGTVAAATLDNTLKSVEPPVRAVLETADTALKEAGDAFASANRVITRDIDAIITDVRGAVSVFTDTVRDASGDIDVISEEILAASQAASGFAKLLETVVVRNQRQLDAFLRLGLPEFLRFAEDARHLVGNLDRFIDRVDRDPARFFLGTQGSEFRR